MKTLILTIVSIILLGGCYKEKLDQTLSSEPLRKYNELGCVTDDGKAGVMCVSGVGGTCREALPCTPIEFVNWDEAFGPGRKDEILEKIFPDEAY